MTDCTRECPPDCLTQKLEMARRIEDLEKEVSVQKIFDNSSRKLLDKFQNEISELEQENRILREGMKGDYDLDAWLEWVKKFEVDAHPNQSIGEQK